MKNFLFILLTIYSIDLSASQIRSVYPATGIRGQTLNITVYGSGTHFTKLGLNPAHFPSSGDITVNSVTSANDVTLVLNITISQTSVGFYSLWIFDSLDYYLIQKDSVFQVIVPYLTTATPNKTLLDETLDVTITGVNTHFKIPGNTPSVSFFQGTIPLTVNSVKVTSNMVLIANISVNTYRKLGFYSVTVVDPMSGTLTLDSALEVKQAALLKSISPTKITVQQNTNFILNGHKTHFTLGSNSVYFYYQGIPTATFTVNNIAVVNDSTLVCNVDFKSSLLNGNYDVHSYNWLDGELILTNAFNVYTGIDESKINLPAINIYPNPANDELNILFPFDTKNLHFEIFNLNGKSILNSQSVKNNTSNSVEISLENISSGMYFLKITDLQTGEFLSKKIMKK